MGTAKPPWAKDDAPSPKWDEPSYPHPMVPDYDTGTDAVDTMSPISKDNALMTETVSDKQPRKTAFHRGAMGAAESLGARLSISPSAKIPQNEPASGMTQANTRIVRSRTSGRSGGNFTQGADEL